MAASLSNEKWTSEKPTEATGRLRGETRSADEIIAANRILANTGDLEDITNDGNASHGKPAGNWKDSTERGYATLKDNHRLDKTSDTHVPDRGGNDYLAWAGGEAGKPLWMILG